MDRPGGRKGRNAVSVFPDEPGGLIERLRGLGVSTVVAGRLGREQLAKVGLDTPFNTVVDEDGAGLPRG